MSKGYTPYGAVYNVWDSQAPAILIDGVAGSGKTFGVLEKLDLFARRHPGCRILICRKTRASMTESVLVTYEQKVLEPGNSIATGSGRANRQAYTYPNGSQMIVGGLDNPDRIMSTEFDVIAVFEATECAQDDIEKLQTRLFRNNKAPYSQIIMDCNPSGPNHFLIKGVAEGKWVRFPSRHTDNPLLYDQDSKTVTPAGEKYLGVLANLTGHRRARLLEGHWSAAEGLVYPEFDHAVHVVDRFPIPPGWRRVRCIDFGYTNPFVCQWWAIDGDGRAFMYREIYHTKRIVSDHAAQIIKIEAEAGEQITETVADHDAEDKATLDRAGIGSTLAKKEVTVGIQAVANRLRAAGDGRPRMFFLRDSLVERDPMLTEAKKPCCTVEEFDGYVWVKQADGKPNKEEPVKVDDHGADASRYLAMYLDAGEIYGGGVILHGAKPEAAKPTEREVVCPCGTAFKSVDSGAKFCSVRCEMEEKRKDPMWGW